MADNLELNETVEAWCNIVKRIWEDKIAKYRAYDSQSLVNSLMFHVINSADGNPALVNFFFNYYGRFVDLGVGKGVPAGSTSITTTRVAKPWYSRAFYSQVMRLSQIYAEKYSQKAAFAIVQNLDGI